MIKIESFLQICVENRRELLFENRKLIFIHVTQGVEVKIKKLMVKLSLNLKQNRIFTRNPQRTKKLLYYTNNSFNIYI